MAGIARRFRGIVCANYDMQGDPHDRIRDHWTNDLPRAAAFYDALLGEVGASRMMETDQFIAWSVRPEAPGLGATKPFDKKPATVGNGVMVALEAKNASQVAALHRKALELGGTDEGAPGLRGEGFYAGYFRDLDGNKLNFFCMG